MQIFIRSYLFVLLFCFKGYYCQTQLQTKRINYLSDNKKLSVLDTVVENVMVDFMENPQNCGFSIGIIKDTSVYFYNYGETKRDNRTLPKQNTIYELGSVSKTFCGILLGYAISEGKIKLNDDIRKYLPGEYPNLKTNKNIIEIKHLANHSSGLPNVPSDLKMQAGYDSLNPYKNYTKDNLFAYLKTVKLESEPGQQCEYSNTGMALLGLILEKVYNKPFEELLKEKICFSNNMNNTAINLDPYQLPNFCEGHNNNGKQTPHWELGAFIAAGGIRSCTNDMVNYLRYNMTEKDEALKMAHTSTINKSSNIALGWHIVNTKYNNELVWHNGATYGFSSFCGFIKTKNVGIVILSNTSTNIDFIALSILKYLQK